MAGQTGSEQKKGIPIVTILTVIGTVGAAIIPILLNMYSSQISNKPDVNLAVTPNLNNDGRKALIELTNHGSATATNLSLTIETPKNISSITIEFSSTDITIPKLNKKLLDMHKSQFVNQSSLKLGIAKFSAGSGSMIKLEMLMGDAKQNLSYYNYTVSAAYDQGSITGKIKSSDTLTLNNFFGKVAEYIVQNPVLVASEIAIIPAGWAIIKWWLGKRFINYHISSMIEALLGMHRLIHKFARLTRYDSKYDNETLMSLLIEIRRLNQTIVYGAYLVQNHFDLADLTHIEDLTEELGNISPSLLDNSNIDPSEKMKKYYEG